MCGGNYSRSNDTPARSGSDYHALVCASSPILEGFHQHNVGISQDEFLFFAKL
jgi:hypothetical protein